jgi:hypothetical protein
MWQVIIEMALFLILTARKELSLKLITQSFLNLCFEFDSVALPGER